MTEWWLILAFFWLWFLADSLNFWRVPRFLISGLSGRRARIRHGQILASAPTPLTWHCVVDDPPFSLSPEGLSNLPAGSTGRPAPDPDLARAWRWEDIREVSHKRGRLLINGLDFCPVSAFANASSLRALAARLAPLPVNARATLAAEHIAAWFRPAYLKRRQKILLARTRFLSELATLNATIAFFLSAYVITNAPAWIGSAWAARITHALPLIGLYFAAIHFTSIIVGWRAHRRLQPDKLEQRTSLLLNAALMPPFALKLRAQIAATAFPAQHPLAWLVAAGRPDDMRRFASRLVSDLRWPLPPRRQQEPALVSAIAGWTRDQIARHTTRLLAQAGIPEASLLNPPLPDGPDSCAYCPRCGDQFTQPQAICPRGIKLLALK